MKKMSMMVLLVVVCVGSTGCVSRAIKEGVGTVTGAKGVYAPLTETADLADYGNFEVQRFTDESNGRALKEFFAVLPMKIEEQLTKDELDTNSGKTAVISGVTIYYEKAGLTGQAFGPFEEAITEVTLTDKGTGQFLGKATCIGRSTQTVNQGAEKKAEGVAKGIAKWIDDVKKGEVEKQQ
jgi:hypothetical protein